MPKCEQLPVFRYTWPGREESFICIEHSVGLANIANALGLFLQLIPLSGDEQLKVNCSQEVKEKKDEWRCLVCGYANTGPICTHCGNPR
jgi:rubrerythrin